MFTCHMHMHNIFLTLPLLYSLRLSLGLLNSQEDSRSIHLDNGYILLNPPEEARPRARPRPIGSNEIFPAFFLPLPFGWHG
ncbi:hypothetical protein M432DRAFT_606148 [Thermoascus aurantiacus ATCC 26904]